MCDEDVNERTLSEQRSLFCVVSDRLLRELHAVMGILSSLWKNRLWVQ